MEVTGPWTGLGVPGLYTAYNSVVLWNTNLKPALWLVFGLIP